MRKSDLVFFLTGAAALVYETVWIRLLARLLGSDAGALAIVLATFMGGMGLGAALFSGAMRRARRPALCFAAIELGLAVWAALSPLLLGLIEPVDGGVLRAGVAALVLLPPTLAMGATFPLMGRLTIAADADTARETSAFYGANTLGAAAGALLGPFLFMPALGLSRALVAAALLDVVAAVAAWRWLSERGPQPTRAALPERGRSAWLEPFVLGAFLLGAFGLALEVTASRVLVSITGASVYAYAIVLAVFLAGIGLGSRQLAGSARATADPARAFALAALWLAPLSLAGFFLLRLNLGQADVFGSLSNRMPHSSGVLALWASHALFAGLALLPPALALGAALPAAAASVVRARPGLGRERALGLTYAANTAGALVGSLLAGFVLLPRCGPRVGLGLLLALPVGAALLVRRRGLGRQTLAALAISAGLAALVLPAGRAESDAVLVTQVHGVNASVAVEDAREASGAAVRSLRVNGKVVATTAPVDLRLQRLLAHVPALLHGDVREALVIGLGTGMTAGALLDLDSLERLEVIEITAAVRQAARTFAEWNGGVVDDPRVQLRIADGRHALARSERRYDLVTSDPIHPWTRGSSDLYSLEHFSEMARHLAPGGVASQWLPLYQLSNEDVRTVVASWCAAFPRTSAWLTAYDLALVGSNEPLPNEDRLHELTLPPRVAAHLADAGVHSGVELAALEVADDASLRAFAAGAEPMRDDRPILEFRAPRSFLGGYSVPALRWAGRPEFVEQLASDAQPRARELRDLLAAFLDALPRGLSAAASEYGEALINLPPALPPE